MLAILMATPCNVNSSSVVGNCCCLGVGVNQSQGLNQLLLHPSRLHFSNFSASADRLKNPRIYSFVRIRCQSTRTDESKRKMNVFDNASNLLTNLLSGGRIGSMPTAEGAVSDLFSRPLFFSLYDWFLEVLN